ncbi:MAG: hypothetical protein RMJ56_02110 [Gemmataceae bacterium]|nr:hypothetical protein [Gemmata sp.]MDW8196379.1 hypothetical protein [Gemmataceae bacterium]
MAYRCLSVLALSLLMAAPTWAQPPHPASPTLEARLRSVHDLLEKFDYVVGLIGQEAFAEQVREIVKSLTVEGKGLEGLDPKQPLGAYAYLEKDIESSPFIVMIPIADREQFLTALKERLDITAEKADDGMYKVPVPQIDQVYLRFLHGYVYVSPNATSLQPKTLIAPKDFFARDDGAVASLIFHIDRVPHDLKKFALGQLELAAAEARKEELGTGSPAEKHVKNLVLDLLFTAAKSVVDDGQELAAKLFIDPKTDTISAELSFSAKAGSPTAQYIAAVGGQLSRPVGIVAAAGDPVASGNVKVAIPDYLKKEYLAALEEFFKQILDEIPADQQELIKQLIAVVRPTLQGGELDAAVGLSGPNERGQYRLISALAVKEGKKIEKFVQEIVQQYGAFIDNAVTVKLNLETIGDFTLHRIDIKEMDEKFEKTFGTKSLWLATANDCLALSIEPEGKMLRAALRAKPAKAPLAQVDVALAKLIQSVDSELKPEEVQKLIRQTFGDGPVGEKDRLTLGISGGEKLTAKFQVKGKGIKVFAGLEAFKK